MSYEKWIRDVYGGEPENYLPTTESLKLTENQKALIMMRLTYHHFANIEGLWVSDNELNKVLDELEF